MSRPDTAHLARGVHGEVLKSNFSTDQSAKTRTLERDRSPAELLAPRRWTPPQEASR